MSRFRARPQGLGKVGAAVPRLQAHANPRFIWAIELLITSVPSVSVCSPFSCRLASMSAADWIRGGEGVGVPGGHTDWRCERRAGSAAGDGRQC